MQIRRRHLLHSGAATLVAGPSLRSHAAARREGEGAAAHALNRLGFGPRPGDLAAVGADPAGWIDRQLQPQALRMPEALTAKLRESQIIAADPIAAVRELVTLVQQNQLATNAAQTMPPGEGSAARAVQPSPLGRFLRAQQLPPVESRLFRALESPRQLEEVMVDFWFNHFNVFQDKNYLRVLVGHYEHFAIRPFAMGRFRDLLVATAHHPAMLYYLDNWLSVGPRADRARSLDPPAPGERGLNENYARELMELHTLGVDGGYTQQDVTELARMLTGWTLVPPQPQRADRLGAPEVNTGTPGRPDAMPGFWFNERMHDRGEKRWLGQTVRGQGQAEGDAALERLARHPATARHIGRKLAQYFVADQPDAALVDRLASVFAAEDGQIVPVLRALFTSDAFWAAEHRGAKFKTPYHHALSALRAGGAGLSSAPAVLGLAGHLAAQGMPLYGCATPDGYKNTEAAWLNPDGIGKRIQFAGQLAAGRLGGERLSGRFDAAALIEQLGPLVTPATRSLVARQGDEAALATTLVLAGPGMMRR